MVRYRGGRPVPTNVDIELGELGDRQPLLGDPSKDLRGAHSAIPSVRGAGTIFGGALTALSVLGKKFSDASEYKDQLYKDLHPDLDEENANVDKWQPSQIPVKYTPPRSAPKRVGQGNKKNPKVKGQGNKALKEAARAEKDKSGLTIPGTKYLGPGNSLNRGQPVNQVDADAQAHDIAYSKAQSGQDIHRADTTFLKRVGDHFVDGISGKGSISETFHAAVGGLGIGTKFGIERKTGVIYPSIPGKYVFCISISRKA